MGTSTNYACACLYGTGGVNRSQTQAASRYFGNLTSEEPAKLGYNQRFDCWLAAKYEERARPRSESTPEIPVKRSGVSLCVLLCWAALAQASETQPVSALQLVAWLVGGVSNARLVRIVHERGAMAPDKVQIGQLKAAGADASLVQAITSQRTPASKNVLSEIPASLLQAAIDSKAQQFHQAELDLRSLLSSDPQNSALHFALGNVLIRQEQWDDAFDEITLAIHLMPDLPENHNSLAYIFYRLDDGPNAIAEARTALSMDPQNAEAYQFLGLALYSNGQYAAAVHALDESLARDAGNADTYYDIGIALHAEGNFASAIGAYRKAIQLKPNFWEAHSNLALTWHEQNKLDEAIAEYREAERLAPQEASVRSNLGNTLCDKGDFEAATQELQELYHLHPEWQQGHGCLARAYMSRKEYGKAIQEWHLAVQQNPTSATEHRLLGETFLLNDQMEEGVRELRLAVSLNPDSDAAHRGLGTALFREQQLAAAEKEFREAVRLNSSPDNHFSLAACLMSMDRYDEALTELDAAARLDPDRALYRARREELLKLMKETSSR
ncbi:MAG: tetratricopeptide repeat protein [Candidatus Sulfotelmatobacter sp.]|jgi:tetratricopeptide (TPR) repeat protein